ncbi:MAG: mandelate racemase/muconate lactonizing enzyme family protein [Planctomycetia bacterium]|nr:mandelate racemase/muconate lactonizing enzyme family protein [Planctomycetia bacterium]
MAKITAVETILDPRHPLLLWVRLHTDAGLVGLGETFQSPRAVAELIHQTLATLLVGQDATRTDLLWHHMFKAVHYAGYAGAEMRAISAIDIALWDLLGKLANQPVYTLLGGACRESIPTYNTCISGGRYNDHERFHADPAGLAKELLSQGIRAMKIWPFDDQAVPTIGQAISPKQLEYGVSKLRAIRDAVGDEMDVALEGHCCWNLPSAIRIARAVEPYRPMWLEELMPPDDPAATRQLRESTSTPLVTSERLMTRFGFQPVLEARAADILMLDVVWTGGFTESRKIAAQAATHQLPVAPHNPGGPVSHFVAAHFSASTYNLFIMESVRAFYLTWFDEVLTHNLVPVDGSFPLPAGPGLGTELREEFLARTDLVRQVSSGQGGPLSGYAVGDPFRTGSLWGE